VKPLTSNVTSRRPPLPAAKHFAIGLAGAAVPEIPADFVEVRECLPVQSDRQLGYFGDGRFVAFRYEPRAEDVMWCDERSFGIATGAWQRFSDEIEPLADLYGVNVGSHARSADHVLVVDRVRSTCYFAPRASAEAFLSRRRELMPVGAGKVR
jgi:hypothetical protein